MSKFNVNVQKEQLVTNKEGAKAYALKGKEKLTTQVLTSLFNEKKFYGDNSQEIVELIRDVVKQDPSFIANLSLFARKEMNLRSISHVLVSELAHSNEGKPFVRETINNVVQRVDDMTEILSYYISTFGKPIPNSLKKGLADRITTFNEYSLAKYNRNNASMKLKDLVCLTHPKPQTQEQSDLIKKLLDDKLETPITWETQLSANDGRSKKDVWTDLIESKKIGYMALLRNLRNILQADVDKETLDKALMLLTNKDAIRNSKQFPFRFYSAYKMLRETGLASSRVIDALEYAIKISTENIEQLKGRTFIAIDTSGSMTWNNISDKSTIKASEIATVMASIANYICEDSVTMTFDTDYQVFGLGTTNGIIANANSIHIRGGGTDITLPIQWMLENDAKFDRVILLSDNEINSGFSSTWRGSTLCQNLLNQYKQKINKDVWFHGIDLVGYGTSQFKGNRVNLLAGWSEKVFDYMRLTEEGVDTLTNSISNYYFS